MRRLLKIGAALLLVATIAACTEKEATHIEQEVSVYELNQPGISIKMTLVGENDQLVGQSTESIIDYDLIEAKNAAEAKAILDELTGYVDYSDVKGITYEMIYGEKSANEKIAVDLKVADLVELANLPGTAFEADPTMAISYSATGDMLESSGFTKQRQIENKKIEEEKSK